MTELSDINAVWWAKVQWAREHRARLHVLYDEYRTRRPVDVLAEAPDAEGWVPHRLSIAESVPSVVPLIVGDILHNPRSALDSLVFALASQEAGLKLSESQEKACNFSICDTPALFDASYAKMGRLIKSDRLKLVLARAQPHYWHARYYASTDEFGDQAPDEQTEGYIAASRTSPLWSLNRMNNIDKAPPTRSRCVVAGSLLLDVRNRRSAARVPHWSRPVRGRRDRRVDSGDQRFRTAAADQPVSGHSCRCTRVS